jgi:4-hydroxy-3-polyprenylbenzoate decarboxylase
MKILLAITGASGSIYGIRLLEELVKSGNKVQLIVSEDAKRIIKYETSYTFDKIKKQADFYYKNSDLFAAPSSGSYKLDAMVIVPCSMKTLSAIANGYCDTLISRAGICCLKEERKLILVIRETPLDLPGIKNILSAKQAGATILPAMPVGKILDQLGIDNSLFKRWK